MAKYHKLIFLSAAAIGLVAILLMTVFFARRDLSPHGYAGECPSLSNMWKQPLGPIGTADVIELTRGYCFGSCPVYTVQVRGDGTVAGTAKNTSQCGERPLEGFKSQKRETSLAVFAVTGFGTSAAAIAGQSQMKPL